MQDELFMRRAIELAHRGGGSVSPNPMVGAVLVHENLIIGEGWHARYGDVHAEVSCLQNVAPANRHLIPQSTIYVTLEPCAHQGKQPACANRLVQEGVSRVVAALDDPFPQVAGRGFQILEEAGVALSRNVLQDDARWMSRRFLSVQEQGRPYIILKWAQSADGYIAPEDRSRVQLSNAHSQALVHKWRTQEAAIMVGYNTALADNPQLTVRTWQGPQPLRIVLDRNLQLPTTHYLLDGSLPTWIITEKADVSDETSRISIPFDESLLPTILERLRLAGKNSLFVEGGAQLLKSFIIAGLWDEARVFVAPKSLGRGIPAPNLINGTVVSRSLVGSDELKLYCRSGMSYCYQPGAIL